MKIGNKLYCYNNYDSRIKLTIGKWYTVNGIDTVHSEFSLPCDDGDNYYFLFNDNTKYYYKKIFYTEKEYRKLKLQKLKSND
jgi:hypothetical protein